MKQDPLQFLRTAFSSDNSIKDKDDLREEFMRLLESSRGFFEKLHSQIKRAKAEDKRLLSKALFG